MINVVAEGGFNTGRLYSAKGQPVYYWQLDNGWLYFRDRARLIDGFIERAADAGKVNPGWLMQSYDRNRYEMFPDVETFSRCQQLRVPEDFDFGAGLRI